MQIPVKSNGPASRVGTLHCSLMDGSLKAESTARGGKMSARQHGGTTHDNIAAMPKKVARQGRSRGRGRLEQLPGARFMRSGLTGSDGVGHQDCGTERVAGEV